MEHELSVRFNADHSESEYGVQSMNQDLYGVNAPKYHSFQIGSLLVASQVRQQRKSSWIFSPLMASSELLRSSWIGLVCPKDMDSSPLKRRRKPNGFTMQLMTRRLSRLSTGKGG